MADNNTILIVDDNPDLLAYFWRLFEQDDGAKFDVLGDEWGRSVPDGSKQTERAPEDRRGRPHRLLCHRMSDSFQFSQMFDAMHRASHHFPLCIVDMRMLGSNGLFDELRGLAVAQRVREIDPEIHIAIVTAKADIDGEDVCRQVGGSTHFFQRPFGPGQEEEFVLKVHALVDEWNERH